MALRGPGHTISLCLARDWRCHGRPGRCVLDLSPAYRGTGPFLSADFTRDVNPMPETHVSPNRAALTACRRASRNRRWRAQSNIAASRRAVLQVAARECGQALVTVPVKTSRFMPESDVETRFLDTFTYWVEPSQAPRDERKRCDHAAMAAAQDPMCATVFGS